MMIVKKDVHDRVSLEAYNSVSIFRGDNISVWNFIVLGVYHVCAGICWGQCRNQIDVDSLIRGV